MYLTNNTSHMECGNPACDNKVPMVSYTGPAPLCYECSSRKSETWRDQECLHEAIERSLPESQKDGAHNLVCTCPKCTPRC